MHPIVRTSGRIRASRPLQAAALTALLLFAVTAAAALPLLSAPGMNGSSCAVDRESQPTPPQPTAKPPAPENFTITGIWESTCEVEFEWTQPDPGNVPVDRYQYRTRKANDPARVWNSWTEIGGGSSLRKAKVVAKGGSVIQIRAAVRVEGYAHSDASKSVAAGGLSPDNAACQ